MSDSGPVGPSGPIESFQGVYTAEGNAEATAKQEVNDLGYQLLKAKVATCFCEHFTGKDAHEISKKDKAAATSATTAALIILAQQIDLRRDAKKVLAAVAISGTAWTIEEILLSQIEKGEAR